MFINKIKKKKVSKAFSMWRSNAFGGQLEGDVWKRGKKKGTGNTLVVHLVVLFSIYRGLENLALILDFLEIVEFLLLEIACTDNFLRPLQ